MKSETVQVTWQSRVKIFFNGAWLMRWCLFGKHWGFVGNSGEGAWKFITQPGWVCASCRPHQEAIRTASVASLRRLP